MQLKALLFNRGIYTQNLKNVGWLGIAYVLCLFFSIPLQVIMIASTHQKYDQHFLFNAVSLFEFLDGFQLILMFTVPVLLAIFLFRYMHVKLSADYIHSLPIKREALFHQNLLFGIVMLLIPVLITGIILMLLSGFVDAPKILNITMISQWVGTTILINTFVFTSSVFVAMFTGSSVFQGVLTYILFIFPAGVSILFFMNAKYFLHGFAGDYYLDHNIEKIVPFIRATRLMDDPLSAKEVIFFILFIVVAYLIALFAYQLRKVETATQAIAFRSLQPVFLYGVTFCSMLLGGLYFGETQGTIGWRIFGYIVASIIGYFVALMILQKSWRVLTKWKGYSLFVVVMVIIAMLIKIDVTGYENRLPILEKIERVYFAEGIYMMDERRFSENRLEEFSERFYYKDPTNIENIRKLHEQIIKTQGRFDEYPGYYRQVAFGYELANGKKIVRQYRVPEDFYLKPNQLFKDILESEEHKLNTYGVLRLNDATMIDKVSIFSNHGMQHLTITRREDIDSFHKIFQEELKEEKIEVNEMIKGSWGSITYSLHNDQHIYSSWYKNYDRVEAWLEERNLLKQARVTADDIAYAVVIKRDRANLYDYWRSDETMNDFKTRPDAIKIVDADQIEECLKLSTWNDSGEYVIGYYFASEHAMPFFETIDINHVPSFIREKLYKD
jgi:ABC-2 type transport system permease protein